MSDVIIIRHLLRHNAEAVQLMQLNEGGAWLPLESRGEAAVAHELVDERVPDDFRVIPVVYVQGPRQPASTRGPAVLVHPEPRDRDQDRPPAFRLFWRSTREHEDTVTHTYTTHGQLVASRGALGYTVEILDRDRPPVRLTVRAKRGTRAVEHQTRELVDYEAFLEVELLHAAAQLAAAGLPLSSNLRRFCEMKGFWGDRLAAATTAAELSRQASVEAQDVLGKLSEVRDVSSPS